VIELNITLKNGLNIPLMSEYFRREICEDGFNTKQDNEGKAFKRLAERLKEYFRSKSLLFLVMRCFQRKM